ncbi:MULTISPECIES: hypothetical protein [Paenibacillus]|uniref:Uncharacterized protein n=1 Tax=Paenibacillus odorifer TaxID=189426 RepID=A0ABX3HZG2_9BACL|nr:hypothetical protein [Paenibacillus odorifer]OMD55280.1 hypothetical protein BSK51_04295 [Paenibacillus odorifer]
MSKLTEIKQVMETLGKSDWKHPWRWTSQKRTKGNGEWGDNEFAVGDLISPIDEKSSDTILEVQKNKYGQPEIYCWDETAADLIAKAPEYITYLLSLLEEKDKALQGQHRYFERISVTFGEFECQRLAKEAMEKYTSSNNEGES